MNKSKIKKVTLSKETLHRLETQTMELRYVNAGNTGPSCTPYKGCTIGGWDCTWGECG